MDLPVGRPDRRRQLHQRPGHPARATGRDPDRDQRPAGSGRRAAALDRGDHSTILEIGISRMSLAPAAFSAGIRVLTPALGTTVSTAFISLLASAVIVG